MSDHIIVDGKKYFEESHLQLANNNTKRAREEIEQWKTWGVVEIAVRNPNVASYVKEWEERATTAEHILSQLRDRLAFVNKQDREDYAALKVENDKLCWSPITPENMPSIDNEIGRRHEHGFWQVSSDWCSMEFERYRAGGWTHFRSINDPKEATDGTESEPSE